MIKNEVIDELSENELIDDRVENIKKFEEKKKFKQIDDSGIKN